MVIVPNFTETNKKPSELTTYVPGCSIGACPTSYSVTVTKGILFVLF